MSSPEQSAPGPPPPPPAAAPAAAAAVEAAVVEMRGGGSYLPAAVLDAPLVQPREDVELVGDVQEQQQRRRH